MTTRPPVPIYGCMIDNLSFDEAVERILVMAAGPEPGLVVTTNVDHLLMLRQDTSFRQAYDGADLRLADGMPLLWAARLRRTPLRDKVSGSDLFEVVCREAAKQGKSVALMGGLPGAADTTARLMQERYPDLQIAVTLCPPHGFEKGSSSNQEVVDGLRQAKPDILFVALGAPKQEVWLHQNRQALAIPVAIGVGATFDFLAGHKRRAPVWMQRVGLEWLHRLCSEPRRLAHRYLIRDFPFILELARLAAWRLIGRTAPATDPATTQGSRHR